MNRSHLKSLKIERKVVKSGEQVVSPLAKYDSNGNLFCIICKNLIKSSSIWKVHVNSKVHKQNVETAKKIDKKNLEKSLKNNGIEERVKETPPVANSEKLIKKSKNVVHIATDVPAKQTNSTCAAKETSDCLPEMFFDDPVVDAKIRNVEYKNALDDEWERFQREMKEETTSSSKLIFGEQATSALNREIIEISEQMHQWSKVIDLENKLKNIVKKEKACSDVDDSDENLSDGDVNDYLDWRSKKFS